jgi:L-iditol 2-dehydrogenase
MLAYTYLPEGKLRLSERPRPTPDPGSAVVRVKACAVCGTDLRTYVNGNRRISPPRVIGHELCAEIVEIGAELSSKKESLSPGERITVTPAIGCGRCYSCTRGYTNLCQSLQTIGFQFDGGFAEFMEIPAEAFQRGNVNHVPPSIGDEEAALAEPVACVMNGQELLGIAEGDTVAVFGAGFIGCLHAELALRKGAGRVFLIEIHPLRGQGARRLLPEVETIDSAGSDLEAEMARLTSGRGAEVVIVACSVGQAQADALRIAARRGRVSLFGGLPGEARGVLDSNAIHYKELSVFGAHASTPAQNRLALEWIGMGRLEVKKYIGGIYALSHIEEAFEDLRQERILKAIVRP